MTLAAKARIAQVFAFQAGMGRRAGIAIRPPFCRIAIEDQLSIAQEIRSRGQGARLGAMASFAAYALEIDGIQLSSIGGGGVSPHIGKGGMAANTKTANAGHILIGDGEGGEEHWVPGGIGHHGPGPSIEGEVGIIAGEAPTVTEGAAVGVLKFATKGQVAWLRAFKIAQAGPCGIWAKSGERGEGKEQKGEAGAQFHWGIVGEFGGIFKGYVGGDILRREDGKRACQDGLNMGEAAIAVGNGGVWARGNAGREIRIDAKVCWRSADREDKIQ